jgi:hypothetical protein
LNRASRREKETRERGTAPLKMLMPEIEESARSETNAACHWIG